MPTARYSWRDDVAKAADQVLIADRRETERFGPLREARAAAGCAEHELEVAARIGADRHRNAEPRALGDLLNLCCSARRAATEQS